MVRKPEMLKSQKMLASSKTVKVLIGSTENKKWLNIVVKGRQARSTKGILKVVMCGAVYELVCLLKNVLGC